MSIPTPHNAAQKGDIARRVFDAGRSFAGKIYCRNLFGSSGLTLIQ